MSNAKKQICMWKDLIAKWDPHFCSLAFLLVWSGIFGKVNRCGMFRYKLVSEILEKAVTYLLMRKKRFGRTLVRSAMPGFLFRQRSQAIPTKNLHLSHMGSFYAALSLNSFDIFHPCLIPLLVAIYGFELSKIILIFLGGLWFN